MALQPNRLLTRGFGKASVQELPVVFIKFPATQGYGSREVLVHFMGTGGSGKPITPNRLLKTSWVYRRDGSKARRILVSPGFFALLCFAVRSGRK